MQQAKWRIVVVDDQDAVRESICELVVQSGHLLCGSAATGEEGVDLVARERPDLVLMDIQMPGCGGIVAARRIRDLPYPAPVVFLTALDDVQIAQDAAESGSFGYLVKPFYARQLGPVMQTAIERFREWQEARRQPDQRAVVHQALDAFADRQRVAGLSDALSELLETVGEQLQAGGAAVCLLLDGREDASPVGVWGERLPESAARWVSAMASVGQPAQSAAGALAPGSPAILAAPLGAAVGVRGLLVAHAEAPRVFNGNDAGMLALFASGLDQALANVRAQQPMAWRRWLQPGRA